MYVEHRFVVTLSGLNLIQLNHKLTPPFLSRHVIFWNSPDVGLLFGFTVGLFQMIAFTGNILRILKHTLINIFEIMRALSGFYVSLRILAVAINVLSTTSRTISPFRSDDT